METNADAGPSMSKPSAGTVSPLSYLETLNDAQRTAVAFPREIPLQILAGPGSGKTRVLTARVAYLVQHWGLQPWEITAVTFTNKAAQEMRKRLNVLLGEELAGKLILGTFHATCASYLRRYGRNIGLNNNFSITDSDDGKKIMKELIKPIAISLKERNLAIKEGQVLSEISKAKAKEEGPEEMILRAQSMGSRGEILVVIAHLYKSYEHALRTSDSLDFDDLLLFGLKLFRATPSILKNCKHILVDEFQDTNTTQYSLMKLFALSHGGITIVGDPDQSIYGWRSAEVENLNHMRRDFPETEAIYLEQNYRSTGAILAASLAIVSQDKERIAKGLHTQHAQGAHVTLKPCQSAFTEAAFIAAEIKRLIAYSGGTLNYGDFAILLRYNALSRLIEVALQKESIPNKVVGGHKFFERMEVKDLLAYLQLVDNPNFTPAFTRVVNVPKRSIGDKSVQDLLTQARVMQVSPLRLAEMIVDGDPVENIKSAVKRNLTGFVRVIRDLRQYSLGGTSVADLLKILLEMTGYEEYLEKSQEDFKSRWENVQELISYAVIVATERDNAVNIPDSDMNPPRVANAKATELEGSQLAWETERSFVKPEEDFEIVSANFRTDVHPFFRKTDSDLTDSEEISDLSKKNGRKSSKPQLGVVLTPKAANEEQTTLLEDTPLRAFLQASMLSTDTESQEDNSNVPKVVLSTVHGAKGLEWPVVFIPCAEDGIFPFYRCIEDDEIREERRLLYVAMTRAQGVLYLSHSLTRMLGGDELDRQISCFIATAQASSKTIFAATAPEFGEVERAALSKILERENVDEDAALEMIKTYNQTTNALAHWELPSSFHNKLKSGFGGLIPLFFNSPKKEKRASEYWHSETDEYALPDMETGSTNKVQAGPWKASQPSGPAFASARLAMGNPPRRVRHGRHVEEKQAIEESPPRPPPGTRLLSSKLEYPEPLPFTFAGVAKSDPGVEPSSLNFKRAHESSLNLMKSLGLPSPIAATSGLGSTVTTSGLNNFQQSSNSSLAFMKNLGPPDQKRTNDRPKTDLKNPTATTSSSSGLPSLPPSLANVNRSVGGGTKRLGMGGRPAPWGSKKPRHE